MSNLGNNNCVEWRLDQAPPGVTLRDKKASNETPSLFLLYPAFWIVWQQP